LVRRAALGVARRLMAVPLCPTERLSASSELLQFKSRLTASAYDLMLMVGRPLGICAILQAFAAGHLLGVREYLEEREIGQPSKLGNHLKWNLRAPHCLTRLVNEIWRGVAKEMGCVMDVRDTIRFKAHKPGAGCICSKRIVCENLGSRVTGQCRQCSISFHDTIGDHKIKRDGRANIENALLNSAPMEDGFSVSHTYCPGQRRKGSS
jgi:hypothetical protein